MKWTRGNRSENVEDRRGESAGGGLGGGVRLPGLGGRGGRMSLGGIVLVLGIAWLTGMDPLTLLAGGGAQLPAEEGSFDSPAANAPLDSSPAERPASAEQVALRMRAVLGAQKR